MSDRALRRFGGSAAAIGVAALIAAGASCRPNNSAPPPRRAGANRASEADILFSPSISTLARLDELVSVREEEPRVIVSASSTTLHNTAYGVIEADLAQGENVFQLLRVVSQNARFRTNGVQPGDIVRYYALLEEGEQQFGKDSYVEFYVGEVLGENRIRLAQPLPAPIDLPLRIEIWRRNDEYMLKSQQAMRTYEDFGEPALGWEYSPEQVALNGAMEQLKSWANAQELPPAGSPPRLLAELSEAHRQEFAAAETESATFLDADGRFLQEQFWLRGVAHAATEGTFGEYERASRLFERCCRLVHLAADPMDAQSLQQSPDMLPEASLDALEKNDAATPERPWKILLYGKGTVEQRAWVFTLAARQIGLPIVHLAIDPAETGTNDDGPRYWCCAAVIDKELFLFDPSMGLPLESADGRPATLSSVLDDPAVLRQYDLPGDPYPVSADDLSRTSVLLEASPEFVSRRMKLLQGKLAGDQSLTLSVDVDAFAERMNALAGVQAVHPWALPYETLRQLRSLDEGQRRRLTFRFRPFAWQVPPMSWKARQLHFLGETDGTTGAKAYYMGSRPPNREIVRAGLAPAPRFATLHLKRTASFWLGEINLDQGSYDAAANFFGVHVLEQDRSGPWQYPAQAGLGAALAAAGETDRAIAAYEAAAAGPERRGMLIRAARLRGDIPAAAKENAAEAESTEPETAEPDTAEPESPPETQAPDADDSGQDGDETDGDEATADANAS